MRKSILYRMLFYALGLLSLALGLTLNTKTGLGASAIISVAYSFSEIFERNFGNVTLALYVVFVAAQMALHLMRAARYAKAEEGALAHAGRRDIKLVLLMDVLQIPLSIVFTRFLNVFSALIPALYTEGGAAAENFPVRMADTSVGSVSNPEGNIVSADSGDNLYGNRSRYVAQYARCPQPRGRHCAGDCGYGGKRRGLHEKLF